MSNLGWEIFFGIKKKERRENRQKIRRKEFRAKIVFKTPIHFIKSNIKKLHNYINERKKKSKYQNKNERKKFKKKWLQKKKKLSTKKNFLKNKR